MSFTAISTALRVISEKKLTNSAKLVLIALASRHNQETGRCDPSLERMGKDMGISKRAVRDGLRELEENGLIQTVHRTAETGRGKRNLTNRYRLFPRANHAGRMGQNLPPKQESYTNPSAYDDLAMTLEDDDDV